MLHVRIGRVCDIQHEGNVIKTFRDDEKKYKGRLVHDVSKIIKIAHCGV